MSNETIAAPATPLGRGAIAIVRLSGSKAYEIALKVTRRQNLTPRYAHLLFLHNENGDPIDRAIVLFFAAPKSYTGEDIVEFQTHGGFAAANALIAELVRLGARIARAGEFSLRAVQNGKMNAAEAEAAAALSVARSAKAATLLARQLGGELERFTNDLRTRILRLIAYAETTIDYAEDVGETALEAMRRDIDELGAVLAETIASSRRRRGVLRGYEAVIIGKPNAGKSSLLNALLGRARAIVSSEAGTTRDLIAEELLVGEHLVRLLDTAGLRKGAGEIETIGIEYARDAAAKADLIIALFDGSKPLEDSDRETLGLIASLGSSRAVIAAINKSDLPPQFDSAALAGVQTVHISAMSDVAPLIAALQTLLDREAGGEEMLLVSERQIALTTAAATEIAAAKNCFENGELELFSYSCRDALAHIGALTRPAEYGEMLDIMFGEFCLGK
ncbi:tRNA modification GTPase MnmE [Campylobacterota bacterium]|nr:tRNA modification GTPase MnmE [Campylobacterota bacterium]